MQRPYLILLLLSLTLGLTACSSGSTGGASSASPVAPGAGGSVSGVRSTSSRPFDLDFPPRNEPFDFRKQLETKYQTGLRRAATSTFVDTEGDIVWTQEYLRYRVNACDHATAIAKVLTQIDGGAIPAVCGTSLSVNFPPRNEPLDFRRQLETKYQTGLRRAATSTFVDLEGAVVWTQEYLRYRVNACDHSTATTKVFSQIDGGAVSPVCGCIFTASPATQTVPAGGGSFTFQLIRSAGSCGWTATADPFITLTATSGADPTVVTYTVGANPGAARNGTITISWTGGSTTVVLSQAAPPLTASFRMFDLSAQSSETTECRLRGASAGIQTTCALNSTSFTFGGASANPIVNFAWSVQYTYDTIVALTQSGTNPNFSFTAACGGTASTTAGVAQPLSVLLTITDSAGNVATAIAGSGSQPALVIRLYQCGS